MRPVRRPVIWRSMLQMVMFAVTEMLRTSLSIDARTLRYVDKDILF
jgi:hypothetical protein